VTLLVDIDPELPTKVRFDGPYKYNERIKIVPGTKFSAPRSADGKSKLDMAWRATLSWQLCLALRTTFGTDLEIGPRLREWAGEYRKSVVEPALKLRMATDEDIPGFEHLFPYQRAGVKFMAVTGRALLTDGMGAGKTASSISALRYMHEHQGRDVFPALIVAPNSTLLSWQREIDKWWPGHTSIVVKGSMGQRRKLLETPADFYIINWEGLKAHSRLAPYGNVALKLCVECGGEDPKITAARCHKHKKELNAIDFKAAIADEVHRAIDGKSQQTRALKAATASTPIKLALSGTPISSNPGDLWSPLNWLMPEAYPSRTNFVDRFMELAFNPWGGQEIIGLRANMEPEFYGGIDPHLRHMPKDYVLSFLPPIVYERRDVDMAPKQAKAYKQMKDQMIADLDGDLLVTTSPLTQATRLLQLASSYGEIDEVQVPVTDPDTGETYTARRQHLRLTDPSCKLDAFMDDLPDFGDESVVVFAVSRQLIELLSGRLEKAGIKHGLITGAQSMDERQVHMDDFQAGRTKLILVTTAAGGTGITLTKGSIAVFLQRPWSAIESNQAEARVHRIGSEQHDVIRIIDYITTDTTEPLVFAALEKKDMHLEKIIRSKEALRIMLTQDRLPEEEDQ
jgi:SNF2 family DNA or RNA helicase